VVVKEDLHDESVTCCRSQHQRCTMLVIPNNNNNNNNNNNIIIIIIISGVDLS